MAPAIESERFRRTLGRYPTGVSLITAPGENEDPVGMVVGTVTSVSLDPPLVAFMPALTSTTWPDIERAGVFCVNVLGVDHERICQAFGARTADRFSAESWSVGPTGSPILDGAVVWIDCEIVEVVPAGDHVIVLGRVLDLGASEAGQPLLFLRGGYGGYIARAQVAADPEFAPFVGAMSRIRPHLEMLAERFGCECVVGGRVADGDLAILASAGGGRGSPVTGLVGERLATVAPFGRTMMAWAAEDEVAHWIAGTATDKATDDDIEVTLEVIRARGYSVSIGDESVPAPAGDAALILDPGVEADRGWRGEGPVHSLSAPILNADGRADYVLAMYGIDPHLTPDHLLDRADSLLSTARALSGYTPREGSSR